MSRYVYIHMYIYTCIYTHVYINVYTAYTCITYYTYICTYMFACVHTYTRRRKYISYPQKRILIYMNIQKYMHSKHMHTMAQIVGTRAQDSYAM